MAYATEKGAPARFSGIVTPQGAQFICAPDYFARKSFTGEKPPFRQGNPFTALTGLDKCSFNPIFIALLISSMHTSGVETGKGTFSAFILSIAQLTEHASPLLLTCIHPSIMPQKIARPFHAHAGFRQESADGAIPTGTDRPENSSLLQKNNRKK